MFRSLALAAALSPALAVAETAWPPEFNTAVNEARTYCEGEFSITEETVVHRDLNDDGTSDWILDANGFSCSANASSFYCGTEGCEIETQIDGVSGALLLHDWAVVTEAGTTFLTAPNSAGEPVRFLWTGTDWALQ